jgi:hypothetical protein
LLVLLRRYSSICCTFPHTTEKSNHSTLLSSKSKFFDLEKVDHTSFKRQDASERPIQVSKSLDDADKSKGPPSLKKARIGSSVESTERELSSSNNAQTSTSAKKLGKRVAKEIEGEEKE